MTGTREFWGPWSYEYLYLRNAPYGDRDRALFLRGDFWNGHPQRARLKTVPVLDTAIYPKDPARVQSR